MGRRRTYRPLQSDPWEGQPDLRVSTAERSEVADTLSTHYAEGRLDAAEFNERVDRAMAAKTRADLAGLLDDLPADPADALPAPVRRRTRSPLVLLVLVVLLVASSSWWWLTPHVPWVLVALGVAWLWHRSHRHQYGPPGPARLPR